MYRVSRLFSACSFAFLVHFPCYRALLLLVCLRRLDWLPLYPLHMECNTRAWQLKVHHRGDDRADTPLRVLRLFCGFARYRSYYNIPLYLQRRDSLSLYFFSRQHYTVRALFSSPLFNVPLRRISFLLFLFLAPTSPPFSHFPCSRSIPLNSSSPVTLHSQFYTHAIIPWHIIRRFQKRNVRTMRSNARSPRFQPAYILFKMDAFCDSRTLSIYTGTTHLDRGQKNATKKRLRSHYIDGVDCSYMFPAIWHTATETIERIYTMILKLVLHIVVDENLVDVRVNFTLDQNI